MSADIIRRMKKILLAIVLVSACAPMAQNIVEPSPVKRTVSFPEEVYASLPTDGTGIVKGQGFLKTVGGEPRYCVGAPITLNPITPYSTEFWNVTVLKDQVMESGDERQLDYVRATRTDAQGRFEIKKVPPGRYYAYCPVVWYVGGQYQGGFAAGIVEVENGETVEVILTR